MVRMALWIGCCTRSARRNNMFISAFDPRRRGDLNLLTEQFCLPGSGLPKSIPLLWERGVSGFSGPLAAVTVPRPVPFHMSNVVKYFVSYFCFALIIVHPSSKVKGHALGARNGMPLPHSLKSSLTKDGQLLVPLVRPAAESIKGEVFVCVWTNRNKTEMMKCLLLCKRSREEKPNVRVTKRSFTCLLGRWVAKEDFNHF